MGMLPDCIPFPINSSLNAVNKSPPLKQQHNRELSSSACHTEYDNAESEEFDEVFDDNENETIETNRLDELKQALIGIRRPLNNELKIENKSAFTRFGKPNIQTGKALEILLKLNKY